MVSSSRILQYYKVSGNSEFIFVPVIYCCITNYSKTWQFKTRNVYFLIVSEDQEFRSSLTEWFWVGICHEVVVKVLARAAVV